MTAVTARAARLVETIRQLLDELATKLSTLDEEATARITDALREAAGKD